VMACNACHNYYQQLAYLRVVDDNCGCNWRPKTEDRRPKTEDRRRNRRVNRWRSPSVTPAW
jgi:hypothetical protein